MKIFKTLLAAALTVSICTAPALAAPSQARGILQVPNDELLLAMPQTEEAGETETVWEPDPDGSVLTEDGGVNYYFDQKETYYNLNMDVVVAVAHDQGIEGDYWVRDDGCKMLGEYIMIAASRDVHPQGSIVPTSLGLGIVVDTGGFAAANPTQVDIAVDW